MATLSFYPSVRYGPSLVRDLIAAAAKAMDLKPSALLAISRKQHLVYGRFAVMKVANEHHRSLPLIGKCLGGMHHTTILHGIRRAAELEKTNSEFAELLWFLRDVAG